MGEAKRRAENALNGAVAESCGNCNAFSPIPKTAGGFCRAKSPVVLMIGIGTNVAGQQMPIVNSYHPQMPADGWCREYERGHRTPVASAEDVAQALAGVETEGTA